MVATPVELGELVFGAGEADSQPFDLAEPALALGFRDADVKVVADLHQGLLELACSLMCLRRLRTSS
ncbi:hypothetical protein [Streptomyces sp. enrichment culture]|uniref:hypothetical protein n=1 Tax=Streptomyces sp. enrichment culture TaxID=1795815 RepID=UPI003F57E5AA